MLLLIITIKTRVIMSTIQSSTESLNSDWELVQIPSNSKNVSTSVDSSWAMSKLLSSYIWTPPAIAPEIEDKSSSITVISEQEAWFQENQETLQKELEPFFPDNLTLDNVLEFVTLMNEKYPKYSIDPKEDLLPQIQNRKQQMIERGEEGLMKSLVGTYALAFVKNASSIRELLQMTLNYCAKSDRYSNPLIYDQTMLQWFAKFEG